mmetsp:Transcript_33945/g.62395  ORF Transcript_33945/g.62395 Transcript_33945/m.62395 type:complete len:204 (-) Transcript_33945:462-1073(-)
MIHIARRETREQPLVYPPRMRIVRRILVQTGHLFHLIARHRNVDRSGGEVEESLEVFYRLVHGRHGFADRLVSGVIRHVIRHAESFPLGFIFHSIAKVPQVVHARAHDSHGAFRTLREIVDAPRTSHAERCLCDWSCGYHMAAPVIRGTAVVTEALSETPQRVLNIREGCIIAVESGQPFVIFSQQMASTIFGRDFFVRWIPQ